MIYYFYAGLNIPSSRVTEIYVVSGGAAHDVAETEITDGLTQLHKGIWDIDEHPFLSCSVLFNNHYMQR